MKVFRLAFAAILFLAACSATGRAGPITQIVSFGDSLSDVGNTYSQFGYPASPPYAAGRYSNGPIWLDHLASALGVAAPGASRNGGLDYAYGGAAASTPAISPVAGYAPLITPALQVIGLVPNVNTQIASYLVNHSPNAGALFTLWAGANDFFDGQTDPRKPADALKADIETLIGNGAKNFLVANLPSLGQTPLGRAEGPAAQAGLNALTVGFNAELNADLNQIQADHPEVQLHRLDAFGLFQSVEANPAAFGLTDVTDPALLAPAGTHTDGFLFWDAVHPTAAAGDLIGAAAYQAASAPEPATVVLLLLGCAGLLGRGRLRRVIGRLRPAVVLGGLLAAALVCAPASGLAQTASSPTPDAPGGLPFPPPLPPGEKGTPPEEAPTASADAATAKPLFQHFKQHFKLDDTWLSGPGRNGLAIDDVEATATVAAPLREGLAPLLFTPGLGAHYWAGPRRSAGPAAPDLPRALYDADVEIGWQPQLAPWLFTDLAVTPGVYSDFKEANSRMFQMRGRGLAVVALSPQFQIVFGALYVNFNRTKILPAGGVIWNPDDDTKLQLLFPKPKLARRLGAWAGAQWWGYLAGEFGGGRWLVERADGATALIDYTDARALLGVEGVASGGLTGHLEIGYVFDREVTVTDGSSGYAPDGAVLLRAGLRY